MFSVHLCRVQGVQVWRVWGLGIRQNAPGRVQRISAAASHLECLRVLSVF